MTNHPYTTTIFTRAYVDGAKAFIAGHKLKSNPYPPTSSVALRSSLYQAAWRDGFKHAKACGWGDLPGDAGALYEPETGDKL